MAFWSRIMNAGLAANAAFRESYFDAQTSKTELYDWASYEARVQRYALLWAYVQGNPYQQALHGWSKGMKVAYGLYKYTRAIYNPAYELASFYRANVWGGVLDSDAGDGNGRKTSLPIIIPEKNKKHEALRTAISTLWRASNWRARRNIVPYYGAGMGDVAIQVIDDPKRAAVYLKIIHPGNIEEVDLDPFGNVKGYTLSHERLDNKGKTAVFTETCERDGDRIIYRIFKDGKPDSWGMVDEDGKPRNEWDEPYGFVPMVFISNKNFGNDYGMSEAFPKIQLLREIDDQGSKLNDQVRKMVDAPWLMAGVKQPKETPKITNTEPTTNAPQPGRQEIPMFYGDVGATASALVTDLSITDTIENITKMQDTLEKAYPELALHRARSGNLAAETLRILQQDAAAKVIEYREVYDAALVNAHMMAITIGGIKGYDGYEAFGADSHDDGDLSHAIGDREVFPVAPIDQIELENKRLENMKAATDAGWSLPVYLRTQGEDEDVVKKLENSEEFKAQRALLLLNAEMGAVE